MKPIRFRSTYLILVLACIALSSGLHGVTATEGDAPEQVAVTAGDANIPVLDLTLLLKPLTKEEIEVERDAWLGLLQSKAREVSEVEIAVKYMTDEMDRIDELTGALETLQNALSSVEEARAAAGTKPTEEMQSAITESEESLQEARKGVGVVIQKVIDAERASARLLILPEIVEEPEQMSFSTRVDDLNLNLATLDHAGLEQIGLIIPEVRESKDAVKNLLIENMNERLADRRQLTEQVNTVLEAWEIKGATEEEILIYRKYVEAVGEIEMEAVDVETKWSLLMGWLTSEDGGVMIAYQAGKFIILLLVFILLALLLGKVVEKALNRIKNISQLLRDFVVRSIRRVVIVIGFIMSLTVLDINIGPILALVGAAGFIIAFALQETLGNFASGLMIMIYKPFDVGDLIDAAGVSGKVESMNLTSTIIKTLDNKLVVVPNNRIWGNVITNITGSDVRRVDMVFGIGYNENIADAERILNDILKEHELVLDDPEPIIRVNELGDSSVNFVCRPWVKTEHYLDVYWDVTRAVKERFDREGISIPFPQRDVHFYQEVVDRKDDVQG